MKIYKSVCPYDCPDACGLLIYVENGRVVKVAGDPAHSFTRGTLCPKMAHYERTVYSERRLLTPLCRCGPKGNGQFRPITWEEALAKIAAAWQGIIEKYGAEAILPYSYAGTMGIVQHDALHGLFYLLGASRLDRTICAPAKGHGWRAVMGNTLPPTPQEAQDSDLIILWSINMLATNFHFRHDVMAARKRGAAVWCIDTYETKTARDADRFVRVRPGTDGALVLGMLHIIGRDGLADDAFISQYVLGWEELKETILPKYTPAYTAAITGVPPDLLEELAHAYGAARAPFIRLGSGQSRYINGAMTSRLITCLPAIVGAWAKKGGGLLASTAGSKAFDKGIISRDEWLRPDCRLINMCQIGNALLEERHPPVQSLFVYSSNPACTAPDQNQVLRGLAREDLFTVVHERFMTDTARYADIVLPATTSLEHSDIYYSYGHYTIQRGEAVIAPLGECRSNWQVAQGLARALHFSQDFFGQSEDDLIARLISTTEQWELPVDRVRLAAGEPVELPLPEAYKLRYQTRSGKIEILNTGEIPALPVYFPPHAGKGMYRFVNGADPRILDSSFNERSELTRSHIMVLFMHPEDAGREHLREGQRVTVENEWGKAEFTLHLTECTAPGQVVSEGVWWIEHAPGDRSVNALTSQRLTDQGGGSTFYDVQVNIRS